MRNLEVILFLVIVVKIYQAVVTRISGKFMQNFADSEFLNGLAFTLKLFEYYSLQVDFVLDMSLSLQVL